MKKQKRKKKKSVLSYWFFLFLICLFFLGCFFYLRWQEKKSTQLIELTQEQLAQMRILQQARLQELMKERKIDGARVQKGNENFYPVAVMIDNMEGSRPQEGLSRANLVIEALAEAKITRFLVFFASGEELKKIGPIRSIRPYFAEWAEELGALCLYSGGSPEALENLKNQDYNVYSLDEFSQGKYFWRDASISSPHNLFTSSELINQALKYKKINIKEPDYQPWLFKDDLSLEQRKNQEQKIKIQYNDFYNLVEWVYDPNQNNYLRYQSGEKHLDKNSSEIRAKNVVIQEVKTEILDEIGRKKMQTTGKGKALIFQDGNLIQGSWQKSDKGDRTLFFDQNSKEIKFNRGTTWIEIVPDLSIIEY